MKFQNPSLKNLLNGWTNGHTHKPKAICSPLFQSWGHNRGADQLINGLALPVHSDLLIKREKNIILDILINCRSHKQGKNVCLQPTAKYKAMI